MEEYAKVQLSKEEFESLKYWAEIGQKKSTFWSDTLQNPEGTKALKDGVKEVVASALASWSTLERGRLIYSLIRITIVVALLAIIIGIASWLTSLGRLDSSSLIFLLGTITGYLLTFLTKIEGA